MYPTRDHRSGAYFVAYYFNRTCSTGVCPAGGQVSHMQSQYLRIGAGKFYGSDSRLRPGYFTTPRRGSLLWHFLVPFVHRLIWMITPEELSAAHDHMNVSLIRTHTCECHLHFLWRSSGRRWTPSCRHPYSHQKPVHWSRPHPLHPRPLPCRQPRCRSRP